MEYIRTSIPEVVLIKPQIFGDNRGFFLETFRQSEFLRFPLWRSTVLTAPATGPR